MSLTDHIVTRIRSEGPLSLSEYMGDCLLHPRFGYYTTRDPLGAEGDFTTAPEMSQMFGEMLGLCLVQCWLDQGRPKAFTLAELGPGRGTLMADVLRAAKSVPGFHDAADVVLVEASPSLRAVQATTLADYDPTWVDQVSDLPEAPLFLLANEFFDALPIRQFVRDGRGWRERRVGLEGESLAFGLGPAGPQPALAERLADTGDGDVVEICPALPGISFEIGYRIETYGGGALILDYGDWRSKGDTLQALRAHKMVDPLETPGSADLTAHVDFEALARACAPAQASQMTPQGVFLERLGITARAQSLANQLSGAALESHIAAHRRLTHPQEMGNLFKVLGLYPARSSPPAGLEQ